MLFASQQRKKMEKSRNCEKKVKRKKKTEFAFVVASHILNSAAQKWNGIQWYFPTKNTILYPTFVFVHYEAAQLAALGVANQYVRIVTQHARNDAKMDVYTQQLNTQRIALTDTSNGFLVHSCFSRHSFHWFVPRHKFILCAQFQTKTFRPSL